MLHPFQPFLRALSFVTLLAAFPAALAAQTTTFEGSSDGWLGVTLPFPTPSNPPTELATTTVTTLQATGGNPDGYLRMADPDGSLPVGNTQYWKAPPSFLGDRSASLGGVLRYDVRVFTSLGTFTQEDVLMTGNGLTLAWTAGATPSPNAWRTFAVPLQAGSWRVGTRTGPFASQAQVAAVLASVTSLYLRGEFQNGPDTMGLDNVAFVPTAVAQSFGAPCTDPAAAVQLVATSPPRLGQLYDLQATGPASASLGVFVHSTTAFPGGIDLGGVGLPGCQQYVELEIVTFAPIAGGIALQSIPLPNRLDLVGLHLYSQAAAVAPVNAYGLAVSAGLDAQLGS